MCPLYLCPLTSKGSFQATRNTTCKMLRTVPEIWAILDKPNLQTAQQRKGDRWTGNTRHAPTPNWILICKKNLSHVYSPIQLKQYIGYNGEQLRYHQLCYMLYDKINRLLQRSFFLFITIEPDGMCLRRKSCHPPQCSHMATKPRSPLWPYGYKFSFAET